jgi:hypothetical protein
LGFTLALVGTFLSVCLQAGMAGSLGRRRKMNAGAPQDGFREAYDEAIKLVESAQKAIVY